MKAFSRAAYRGIHIEVDEQQILVQTMHHYCTSVCAVSLFPAPYPVDLMGERRMG